MFRTALALVGSIALVGTAVAQTTNDGGASKDTSGYAGGAQKAGASNQNAGSGNTGGGASSGTTGSTNPATSSNSHPGKN